MNLIIPFYEAKVRDSRVVFYQGDSLQVLRSRPQEPMFDMVITSPPYYRIFNYKKPGQYGLEPVIQDYLSVQGEVFDQVRLRLPPSRGSRSRGGTAYIVMGDKSSNHSPICSLEQRRGKRKASNDWTERGKPEPGFAEKEVLDVPFRLSDRLRVYGWKKRANLVWDQGSSSSVPNSDAAPKCHESILHMVRSDSQKARFYGNTFPLKSSVLHHTPDEDHEHGCVFPQSLSDELVESLRPQHLKPVILDCYMGRGTVAWSAIAYGYDFVGIDLDCRLAVKRLRERFDSEIKEEVYASEF